MPFLFLFGSLLIAGVATAMLPQLLAWLKDTKKIEKELRKKIRDDSEDFYNN